MWEESEKQEAARRNEMNKKSLSRRFILKLAGNVVIVKILTKFLMLDISMRLRATQALLSHARIKYLLIKFGYSKHTE